MLKLEQCQAHFGPSYKSELYVELYSPFNDIYEIVREIRNEKHTTDFFHLQCKYNIKYWIKNA